jgi:hypothetical protein
MMDVMWEGPGGQVVLVLLVACAEDLNRRASLLCAVRFQLSI